MNEIKTLDNKKEIQEIQENKEIICKEIISILYSDNPEIDLHKMYDLCKDNITQITNIKK